MYLRVHKVASDGVKGNSMKPVGGGNILIVLLRWEMDAGVQAPCWAFCGILL